MAASWSISKLAQRSRAGGGGVLTVTTIRPILIMQQTPTYHRAAGTEELLNLGRPCTRLCLRS